MRIHHWMEDLVNSKEFYELLQRYRLAPIMPQNEVVNAFEALKLKLINTVLEHERATSNPYAEELLLACVQFCKTRDSVIGTLENSQEMQAHFASGHALLRVWEKFKG